MPRKSKIKWNKKQCKICGKWLTLNHFHKRYYKWKVYYNSYCCKCESRYKMEHRDKEAVKRSKEKYKFSYRWLIRQIIDDYLYKKDKKFRKSMEILKKLDEWNWKEYKMHYLYTFKVFDEEILDYLYKWKVVDEVKLIKFILDNRRFRNKKIEKVLTKKLNLLK